MFEPIIWSVIVLGGLGAAFGVMLGVAAKKFAVKKDERAVAVRENLPGANCGGCGYPGCDGLADALVAGKAEVSACAVVSQENAKKIGEILGISVGELVPKVARIMCLGSEGHCKNKFEYDGALDCRAAYAIAGGFRACKLPASGSAPARRYVNSMRSRWGRTVSLSLTKINARAAGGVWSNVRKALLPCCPKTWMYMWAVPIRGAAGK